jgi:hypothetical protein
VPFSQFTVTLTEADDTPFTTTTNELAPVSMPEGTSKEVETGRFDPTPM